MARLIFTTILIFHGLLHLIGFAKEWDITAHPLSKRLVDLMGNSSKVAGVFWLLACALFITTAASYLLRRDWYWMPAAAALLISQTLIFIYWNEARYGTAINIIISIGVILSAAVMRFDRMADQEVQELLRQSKKSERIVTEQMIVSLPECVRRWVKMSNVLNRKLPNTVQIEQHGQMRTKPGGSWMPFKATQYFSVDPPAFVWVATIKAAPFFTIAGRDKFSDGHGNMLIKPLYFFEAANSSGNEVDQGTLLRYMAEMAWFPQSAISPYVRWESLGQDHARITMSFNDVTAEGVYYFDTLGRVTGFEAQRYGDFGGAYKKEMWSITTNGFKEFNNLTIGHKNDVTWKLKDGDFHWLKVEVTDIHPIK